MKKILAFFLTALMIMSMASVVFAASAADYDTNPYTFKAGEDAYVLEESESEITIEFYVEGLTDEHDLGALTLAIHYDDDVLTNTDIWATEGKGSRKILFGAAMFEGGYQLSPVGANPLKSVSWTVMEENPLYASEYFINEEVFLKATFELADGWTGITELEIAIETASVRTSPDMTDVIASPAQGSKFTIQRGEVAPEVENTLFVSGPADVTINDDTTPVTADETGFAPAIGDKVTLAATGENFLYWENTATGNVFSYDSEISFIVGDTSELSFSAVYGDDATETVNVTFKDGLTGKIHAIEEVAAGTALNATSFPAHTPILGYAAHTYSVASGASFVAADGYVVNEDTTVILSYTKDNSTQYTLTVDNGYKTIDYSRSFGAIATVYANVDNFSYWTDDNGTILSLDPVFKFIMPNADTKLIAVANAVAPDAVLATVENELSNGTIVTTFARDLAEGFELVEAGVLYTRKGTEADLVVPKTSAFVTQGISTAEDNVYGFVKNVEGKAGTWLVRGYMTYTDGSANYTVYTAVESIVVA